MNSERANILDAHLAEREVDIDRHVRRRLLAAGAALFGKRKLYLDTNFWVALRKAALGRGSEAAVRLLELDAHDLLDFQHAAAALAYCDGFLTDGPMRTMIEQKHLALDAELGCRVASSPAEALKLVSELRPS